MDKNNFHMIKEQDLYLENIIDAQLFHFFEIFSFVINLVHKDIYAKSMDLFLSILILIIQLM